ncbi:DUF2163 domain-containing protein [Thermaurantiacus sp.]
MSGDRALLTVALVATVTRPDGVKIGLTGHDRDLEGPDLVYEAAAGMVPAAIELGADFEVGSGGLEGALSSRRISVSDLEVGRWSGAEIRISALDWSDPGTVATHLARGTVGSIERSLAPGDRAFRMEFLSPLERLARRGPPRCSPTCRARLGDPRCGVDLAFHEHFGIVDQAEGDRLRVAGLAVDPAWLAGGLLRFLDGPLAGVDREITSVADGWIVIEGALGARSLVGARVRVREGCDRRFSTCVARFGNGHNFDGEPHVPGDDLLFRYGDL